MESVYRSVSTSQWGYHLTKTVQNRCAQLIYEILHIESREGVVLRHISYPFNICTSVESQFETGILKGGVCEICGFT